MKLLIAVVIVTLSGVCCSKDELDDSHFWGTASVLKNGVSWNPRIYGGGLNTGQKMGIILKSYQGNFLRESLGILNIKKQVGIYRMFKTTYSPQDTAKVISSYHTSTDDGDVGCDNYHIIEQDSLNNFVEITSYDAASREVKGKFSGTYVIELPKCDPLAPDTLRIRNGQFHTKITL